MLPIIVCALLLCSISPDVQGQQALSLGQPFVSMLDRFCHYFDGQMEDFVCTCILPGSTQALSSSLDQFCEFMSAQSKQYNCRCVFRPGGGPPYPVAPGFEKAQRQPSLVFLQQQNGRPIFVNAPPQQNQGPIFINGQPQPTGPIFIQGQPQPTGPVFINAQPQPQPQPARGDDGRPIIIQLQPSPVTVLNNGNDGDGQGRPKVGVQTKDNPDAAPVPAPAPTTTAAPDLTSLVFVGEGAAMITRCPVGTPISWVYHTWMEGSIRPYYEFAGERASLEDCKQSCEVRDDCFFATFTSSRKCYFLSSTHTEKCGYQLSGHYGHQIEQCTPQRPCPSAYKRCSKPDCTLQSIIQIFCTTQNKLRAVTSCRSF